MAGKEENGQEPGGLAQWWQGLWGKASRTVADQEAAFARGKVAGVTVTNDDGTVLVEAGHRIDADILAQARASGKIAALAAAAVKGQTQDIKERVDAQVGRTETARETKLLDSVDDFREARNYLGRALSQDVTDIRGHIVVPAGKTLDDEDIRTAREAGQLAALVVVARESPLATQAPTVASAAASGPSPMPLAAVMPAAAAPRRAPLLLATPEDEEETPPDHRSRPADS